MANPNQRYKFKYLSEPNYNYAFKSWCEVTAEFLKHGEIEYFYGLLCPVSSASVNVLERSDAEYDTIELTILKLYSAGIKDSRLISMMMGISRKMVDNILNILKNTYHHIENGALTKEGKKSLDDERNIHTFETVKNVQFEALTGILLKPSMFQSMSGIEAYYGQENVDEIKRFLPKHYIEKDIRQDLKEHIDYHRARGIVGRNVEKIISVNVEGVRYTEAFLVKYSFLKHPFLIFPVKGNYKTFWNPVAISESTKKEMDERNINFEFGKNFDFDVSVADDSYFSPFVKIETDFNLKTPKAKPEKNFCVKSPKNYDGVKMIVETHFEMVKKDTEGAFLHLHPSSNYTPVYCIQTDEITYEAEKEAK